MPCSARASACLHPCSEASPRTRCFHALLITPARQSLHQGVGFRNRARDRRPATPVQERTMSLSKRSLTTLLDLVEIKLSCIEVMDREDAKEMAALEAAKRELTAILQR